MDIKRLLLSAALAGTGMALLSSLPVLSLCNLFFCGWIWIGSIFAAWHYDYLGDSEQEEVKSLRTRDGAIVGALSGLIAAVIGGVIYAFMIASLGAENVLSTVSEVLGIDPAAYQQMFADANLESESALTAANLILNLPIYTIIGSVGGSIGALVVARRRELPPQGE